jgi:hypothetical protein
MPVVLRLTFAICVVLTSTLLSQAQAPSSSTLRPSTDSSVTTGIGTGSTFRNVAPPTDQPPPDTFRKFMWDTPEATEAFRKDKGKENGEPSEITAPSPPAAEAKQDPRTMITRDRIESPQH